MERISAHFDCQFGAAGDMLLAALLDAGLDPQKWLAETQRIALPLNSFKVSIEKVKRCSLSASKVTVKDLSLDPLPAGAVHDHPGSDALPLPLSKDPHNNGNNHAHEHEHVPRTGRRMASPLQLVEHEFAKEHEHEFAKEHEHEFAKEHGNEFAKYLEHDTSDKDEHAYVHEHRNLADILQIIQNSDISVGARDLSSRIFQRLARAEARVHGVSVEEIHFHEVGGIDAIVDIVGFAVAYCQLEIEDASCSPLPLGGGTVKTTHGRFPVPSPAVLELLKEAGAQSSELSIPFECLTPTGAAILCEISKRWCSAPAFAEITATGYGAGTKNTNDWPNTSRVILGVSSTNNTVPAKFATESISVIEANIDDQTPQALAFAVEKILKAGALDVFTTPVLMKKGRSAQLLTVLCQAEDECRFQELVITETSSLGARLRRESRLVAERRWSSLNLVDGTQIRIKLAYDLQGKLVNRQPEFDDLAAFALEKNISIKEAQNLVAAGFNEAKDEQKNSL